MTCSIFWFRRDLRLEDNTALSTALRTRKNILPIFIFDENILNELENNDPRVYFIYQSLEAIDETLKQHNSSLYCVKGNPLQVWKQLLQDHSIDEVFVNRDYEPYATQRDKEIESLLESQGVKFSSFKDQVIFEQDEIVKGDGHPYTVFTPYKNKWLTNFEIPKLQEKISFNNFLKAHYPFPSLKEIAFTVPNILVQDFKLSTTSNYARDRDYPAKDATSYLGPHLRFGTVSIRQIILQLKPQESVFLSELIWREFFMQILYHYPHVVNQNFRAKYDGIQWINDKSDFEKWCNGQTGYPMVDAGMRQLNETGFMHNRVRMITAGFLCKHLLIDWRWGEAYFAKKLLDYELSSNNGNWQWAAGTGCDAAPYFRIFNPITQLKKFDKDESYINRWVPEYNSANYQKPIVEHKHARERALDTYKRGIIQSYP
jgi:deoxyribodipyrimidine photo-lyase